MLKNLLIYRVGPGWATSSADLLAALEKAPFVPCGSTQPLSVGWVPPRGDANAPLLEAVDSQWLMQLMVEVRAVPGAIVKRRTDERAVVIEQETGRKPGKKARKALAEEIELELLPQAFPKQSTVTVWMNPKARLLMIDAASVARADDVVTTLVRHLDGLTLEPLHTAMSPAACMAVWLTSGDPPRNFTVDTELELKAADETKAVVRYARHTLDISEVRQHIEAGKLPTQLALTWMSRISLLLTDALVVKRIMFLDGVFEGRQKEDAFDADAAIATGELGRMLPDLFEALGGEGQPAEAALAA